MFYFEVVEVHSFRGAESWWGVRLAYGIQHVNLMKAITYVRRPTTAKNLAGRASNSSVPGFQVVLSSDPTLNDH
jgi:hypothetical protein